MAGEHDFEDFYQSTRHRVVTVLYALGGNMADAQDAVQEAYARAWQRWSKVGGYADPEAWVRTVARRIQLNRWRKLRNGLTAYRRHGADPAVPPPSENAAALVAALRQIPADQREAIVLHHMVDMSVAEVATHLGAPVNTIKTRLARGRKALAELIGEQLKEESVHA
ncbi:SigE family RNA polymerase sigma factor [Plantactinospora sp. S1510]|uniref:SigE family RNA polymerase sigma factor n=1 Tax=Plantactinospora alkalitolerans TaxID=2789879 RepID=A0ABS0GY38_9ACTN|nr:SigE family RNA polymerase sigma factor [Plantactinospora alkalitolerans]MBF9131120.1 SigE family RNA polymerase sigma factor [Plantactinospora alkalitolerans]